MSHLLDPLTPARPSAPSTPSHGNGTGRALDSEHALDPPHLDSALAVARQPGTGRVSKMLIWLVGLSIFGSAAYLTTSRILALRAASSSPAPPARVIPVVTATARARNLDLHLSGLGTVTAFNSVTIRSRVEGELLRVAFEEGQMVQQGQLLAEIDPRRYQVQLDQMLGQLAKDQAALKNAQLDLARSTSLVGSRAVTQQQVDTHAALVQQNEGIVKSDQAQVEAAELQLSYCRITAPISGRIGLRTVDQGNMIQVNDPRGLAVITQLQPIAVLFTIPQDDISRVQRRLANGDPLVVEAHDRGFDALLATGQLSALDNQVDAATGTLRIKAVFPNDNSELFPNQFVNARLKIETLQGVIVVPSAAVQRGPANTFVYVVNPEGVVELRTVLLGPTAGDDTVIESGLAADEVVVTDGVDKLLPGSKVASVNPGEQLAAAGAAPNAPPRPDSAATSRVDTENNESANSDSGVEPDPDAKTLPASTPPPQRETQ